MLKIIFTLHYATQVGEHLLSLVQELESFAASDALPDLLLLPGEADGFVLRGWKGLRAALDIREVSVGFDDRNQKIYLIFAHLHLRLMD